MAKCFDIVFVLENGEIVDRWVLDSVSKCNKNWATPEKYKTIYIHNDSLALFDDLPDKKAEALKELGMWPLMEGIPVVE